MMAPVRVWMLLGVTGLVLGSCVGTAALRWAKGRQSSRGRSSCDHCGVHLDFARTAPVVSYVAQQGVCFACGGPIDPAHLFGELAGAFVLVTAFMAAAPLRAILLCLLGMLLLADATCDAKTGRLPDGLAVAIGLTGSVLAVFQSLDTFLSALACGATAFLCLEGLRRAYLKARGRPGLGFGDVKLVTALALWTRVQTPWVVVLAALLGLGAVALRRTTEERLAFGPHIAVAAWIVGISMEARLWPVLA